MRTVSLYLAARVVPALGSMGVTLLCIQTLSAEQYGRYSLTLLPAAFASGLIGGFCGQAMLRYGNELAPAAFFRGLVGLPLLAAAVSIPLVLAYLHASVGVSFASWLAVGSIPIVALLDVRRNLFVARGQARAVFAMDALRALTALVLTYGLFRLVEPTIVVPLGAQLIALATGLAVVRPGLAAPARGGLRQVDRRYAAYGLWFAGWIGVAVAFPVAERSIVEAVRGLAASGRYAAQADVVNAVFATMAGALASSMMPRYLSAAVGDRSLRRLEALGIGGTFVAAALCAGVGAALRIGFDGRIAQALSGDAATGLGLVAAGFLWAAAGFVHKPLELRGRSRDIFVAAAIAFVLFLVIAPAIAHLLGAPGVAWAKAIAGIAFVGFVGLARRRGEDSCGTASSS